MEHDIAGHFGGAVKKQALSKKVSSNVLCRSLRCYESGVVVSLKPLIPSPWVILKQVEVNVRLMIPYGAFEEGYMILE